MTENVTIWLFDCGLLTCQVQTEHTAERYPYALVDINVLLLHSIQVHTAMVGLALNATKRGQESGGSVKLALTTTAIVAGLLRVL